MVDSLGMRFATAACMKAKNLDDVVVYHEALAAEDEVSAILERPMFSKNLNTKGQLDAWLATQVRLKPDATDDRRDDRPWITTDHRPSTQDHRPSTRNDGLLTSRRRRIPFDVEMRDRRDFRRAQRLFDCLPVADDDDGEMIEVEIFFCHPQRVV